MEKGSKSWSTMILTRASFYNIYTSTLGTNNLERTYIVAIQNSIYSLKVRIFELAFERA